MRYEEFFFTQNLLEVLSEKMELPSYLVLDNSSFEDLYSDRDWETR